MERTVNLKKSRQRRSNGNTGREEERERERGRERRRRGGRKEKKEGRKGGESGGREIEGEETLLVYLGLIKTT